MADGRLESSDSIYNIFDGRRLAQKGFEGCPAATTAGGEPC